MMRVSTLFLVAFAGAFINPFDASASDPTLPDLVDEQTPTRGDDCAPCLYGCWESASGPECNPGPMKKDPVVIIKHRNPRPWLSPWDCGEVAEIEAGGELIGVFCLGVAEDFELFEATLVSLDLEGLTWCAADSDEIIECLPGMPLADAAETGVVGKIIPQPKSSCTPCIYGCEWRDDGPYCGGPY